MNKKTGFLKSPERNSKERYLVLFVVSFIGMMIAFLPSMLQNGGIFLYYGDFNSQQVMFYQHAHDAVQAGNMGWDWGTDLGTSFMGSYSFYLLGSPFFWLTTIFPSSVVPYLLPWLLALKTAVAAMTAYAFIRRFVENKDAAFIGGLLYAFSGFQTYNVFFNHFHDATAFFPLLLLGFEMLVQDNKKGPFAIAVAICASISYFFFACEAVFLVIYFFLRCIDKSFNIDMKKFGLLILEAVIGVLISCVIFVPACIDVITNPRLTERLYGIDMVVYSENVRIPRIIQAFFMLSDMPARINILNSDKARWASLAGYLPMFSMAGVIAYMRTKKKDWASKAVIVFGIMACVPILNSAFVLFNASYYARWYYMPILLMCMMTAKVLSDNKDDLKKGFVPVVVVSAIFIGIGLLPTYENGKAVYGKLPEYPELYYVQAAVTILMLVMLCALIYYVPTLKEKFPKIKIDYMKIACAMTTVAVVICMTSSVVYGAMQETPADNKDYIERAINGADNLDMDKLETNSANYSETNNFYRIDTSENVDNWCMFWGLSSMRTFHSVVDTSIMDFYTSLGQTRDVASRMETKLYPLRGLLSVKYYFNELSENQRNGTMTNPKSTTVNNLKGFEYADTQNGFNIYENKYYVPMGFTYDYFCTDSDIQKEDEVAKTSMLMKALVLDTNTASKYSEYISYYNFKQSDMTEDAYYENCLEKQKNACDTFSYSTNGFDATITLESPKLVFFSVPYDDGWSAQVNGQSVDIEKVDYGFMAVLCQAGDNTIHFDFEQNYFKAGVGGTCAGIVIFIGYIAYFKFRKKNDVVSQAEGVSDDKDKDENKSLENADNNKATAEISDTSEENSTEDKSDS